MVKAKPNISELVPPNIAHFAKGAGNPVFMPHEVAATPAAAAADTPVRLTAPAERAELKRQVALRLTDSTIRRAASAAGSLTATRGSRVSQQDVLEEAVQEWLDRYFPEPATPA